MSPQTHHGHIVNCDDVTIETAKEMAAVGIIPSKEGPDKEPVGYRFTMAGQVFVVTGYVTREEFLAAVADAGFPVAIFAQCPRNYHFQRISTD
jgi:hypothetical protein